MSQIANTTTPKPSPAPEPSILKPAEAEVLCPHCCRTATNGIKCQGICVADSNY